LRSKVEFGDALLLVYLIAIVRQWFWIVDNSIAWIATIPIALAIWVYYVVTKTDVETAPPLSFWLIVGLPLLGAFLLRFPFPDSSFDVWGLRLFHGERGLRGFIYWPGEFFPTAAPFNPTPDMITAIFRQLLGYRLGTVVNLLALLWTAVVVEKLLRQFIKPNGVISPELFRAILVLLIVTAEHLLFEINNYMPDLLALPLLLEATRITLKPNDPQLVTRTVVRVAFLIGMAVTIKLSNGAVAMPLVLIWSWRLLSVRSVKRIVPAGLASIAVVALQLLPFSVWVYKLTGSPVFPLYNKIFRSPMYPPFNGWDDRWGGYGLFEVVTWPVLMFLQPVRTAELPVYTGRVTVGFIVAILCLFVARRLVSDMRVVAMILLVSTLLWSITMGYIRYGLYLEVLAGVLLAGVAAELFSTGSGSVTWLKKSRFSLALAILLILTAQTVMAFVYLQRYEWSLRPTVFKEPVHYQIEAKHILSDRTIKPLLGERERKLFGDVDVWIVSGVKTVGLMPFLNSDAKVIGVRAAGLFLAPANRAAFETAIRNVEGKRLRSIALGVDYMEALYALRGVGLTVGDAETVVIPLFSSDDPMSAYFFEVNRDVSREAPTRTEVKGALPDNTYRASLTTSALSLPVHPGQIKTSFFRVQNISTATWPSQAGPNRDFQVVLRARWLKSDGTQIGEPSESVLPFDLVPGESTALPLEITAPAQPGAYTLEIDMAQRTGPTFKSKGSNPLQLSHRIE
jgi:hypothetical protein